MAYALNGLDGKRQSSTGLGFDRPTKKAWPSSGLI
jgi:hypothetical protein